MPPPAQIHNSVKICFHPTRKNTDTSSLLSIFTICIISAADLYFWNSFSLSKSISKEYKTFWSFYLRSINKNNIWIEIQKTPTNPVIEIFGGKMEARDWSDFFEFQFKCYSSLCFLQRKIKRFWTLMKCFCLVRNFFKNIGQRHWWYKF